jgi:hypothetical protein
MRIEQTAATASIIRFPVERMCAPNFDAVQPQAWTMQPHTRTPSAACTMRRRAGRRLA